MKSLMLASEASFDQAKTIISDSLWVVEEKYDGVRAYIKDGQLISRSGRDFTDKFPEFTGLANLNAIFDGEIISQSGEFTDISGRVHMKDNLAIKLEAQQHPARFMCFDIITDQPLNERRKLLEAQSDLPDWFSVVPQMPATAETLTAQWDEILKSGKEGLMIKHINSKYEFRRSSYWLKVKSWREGTFKFTIYEPNPAGITIETPDGRRVVVNGAQSNHVANLIDVQGYVNANIQYLKQKNSDAWRFPSFRGVQGG